MNKEYNFSLDDCKIRLGYKKWIKGSQNRHLHDAFEILYIVSGNRNMFINSTTYIMKSGDIIIIPPNVIHKSFNNLSGSQIFSLYIKTDCNINNMIHSFHKEVTRLLSVTDSIHNKFLTIRNEFKNKEIGYESIIKSISLEILILLLRDNHSLNIVQKNVKIIEIVNYINKNYKDSNINLNILSTIFSFSSGHLCRLFAKETGFNLIEYINHVRVLNAKKIMSQTNLRVGNISEICGFGSYTNFGRVFKKLTGLSPRDYKKFIEKEKYI